MPMAILSYLGAGGGEGEDNAAEEEDEARKYSLHKQVAET